MVDFLANAENMKPLKEGRTPQVLMQTTLDPRKLRFETETAVEKLHSKLRDTETDPVKAYSDYIKALKQLYPSGNKLVNQAVYEAAMYFVENENMQAHLNDARLLNIYLELADKQQNPKDTFLFMKDHSVAQQLPKFHLAFASVLERAKEFDRAGQSYADAVFIAETYQMKQDLELAKLHLQHYKRRMARRAQEARAIHGPRSPEANKATRGGRPPMATRAAPVATARLQPAALQQQQVVKPLVRAMGGKTTTPSNIQPAFQIYDENAEGKVSAKRPLEATWKTLETESTAVENHGPAQSWNAVGTMPMRGPATAQQPSSKKQQPAFEIYREEEAQQQQQVEEPLDERTINSQMAFNDMMDIFGSPRNNNLDVMATPGGGAREEDFGEGENVSPNVLNESYAPIPMTSRTAPRTTIAVPTTSRLQQRGATATTATTGTRRPILAVIEHDEDGVSPSFRRELHFPSAKTQERFQVFQDTTANDISIPTRMQQPTSVAMRKASTHHPTPGPSFKIRDDEADEERASEDVTYDGGTFGISRVLAFDAVSVSRSKPAAPQRAAIAPTSRFAVFQDDD